MKICRYSYGGAVSMGVVKGNVVYRMEEDPATGTFTGEIVRGEVKLLDQVKLLPASTPSKIVAIGLNYKAHAAEFNKPLPETPMLFMKPSTAVIGHGDAIVYPSHMSHRVDYEGELAVVVGRKAKDVPVDKAQDYILGYTCINDVTARDLQGKDVQFTRAKGFDTFAPIGPWVETDLDPLNAKIETWLNGEKKQDTSTKDMIFNVYEVFSFVSSVMTLLAGDVIATGTPSGVGKMSPGDTVEVVIEGIGTLKNTVVARQQAVQKE